MKTLRFICIVQLIGFAWGCVKNPLSVQPVIPIPSAKGVYILNEGLFGMGNSTLSYYDLESFRVFNDVFAAVNSRNLGDVGNQIVVRGEEAYIVVNNSDRIEIIDVNSHRSTGTINVGAGKSPRQLAFANDSLGLVTNLYDNSVSLLQLKSRTILGRIPVGDNPEGIAVAAGRAFVANSGFGSGRTVSVIDLASLRVVKTLRVGDNPAGVYVTPYGRIYVVCAGSYGDFSNPDDDTPARIMVIDPVAGTTIDSITIGGHSTVMAFSSEGWGYIPTTDSVVTVDTRVHRVVGTFVRGNYYGVGVEGVSGDVYLSDVRNYLQPGRISVFAPNGQVRTQFEVGLVPGSIAFKR